MIENRITRLFREKPEGILNIFCTAGYPGLNDIVPVIESLVEAGVDMVEVGIPFSDPIADGSTIQYSNQVALANGMNLHLLLDQLTDIRSKVDIPILLMGYLNPVLQYGIEDFVTRCAAIGIDGLILPDLPMAEYEREYQSLFEENQLSNIFLITPQTSEARIRKIDALSQGFIYMVSTDSTTGKTTAISTEQEAYFRRIAGMKLENPRLIGFGISDHASYRTALHYAQGAIIGSAFIKALSDSDTLRQDILQFVARIRGNALVTGENN